MRPSYSGFLDFSKTSENRQSDSKAMNEKKKKKKK